MKIQFKLMLAFAALIIIASGSPSFTVKAKEEGFPVPGEKEIFSAYIEYSFEGYVVKGSLAEFVPNIRHVQPMYSLDGQTWQPCGVEWKLDWMDDSVKLTDLQDQICLYDSFEPLKSYLAGNLDRFYLKLRLFGDSGIICETNAVAIERGTSQQVPGEITFMAAFVPAMCVFERNPFRYYGRYQIDVKADTAPQDIYALLPDTIPVEVQLQKDKKFIGKGIVACPVTWKSLPIPQLTAGETVTLPDAAEELVVPAGTLVSTPIGVFQLEEPLMVAQDAIITDEIRLVLNVLPEGEKPSETPADENSGGAGGNEANAGADNKKDSTEEGQRPVLPRNPENEAEVQQSNPLYLPDNKPQEQRSDAALQPDSQLDGHQPDPSSNMGNVSEVTPHSGLSFESDYENLQSQQGMASAYRFEYSAQLLTAEAVADICTSVVAARVRANIISSRMVSQIACLLNMMLFIK